MSSIYVRRADASDQRSLTALASAAGGASKLRKLHGAYNFAQLIETSYLAASALEPASNGGLGGGRNSSSGGGGGGLANVPSRGGGIGQHNKHQDHLVGFIALNDAPNMTFLRADYTTGGGGGGGGGKSGGRSGSSGDGGGTAGAPITDATGTAEEWLSWFAETYCPANEEVQCNNTLWVDLVACAAQVGGDRANDDTMENLLRTVFCTVPEIDYILLPVPIDDESKEDIVPACVSKVFLELRRPAAAESKLDTVYGNFKVYMCDRMAYLPTLAVRTACVEDHDDLVPIFEAQSALLTETYGEFFLASMIEAQDDENKALVALVDNRACGLMAGSSDIELSLLQQCFELQPYESLAKLPAEVKADLVARKRKELGLDEVAAVSQRNVPHVLILGPPGSGKTSLAAAIAEAYDCVQLSVGAVAKEAAARGFEGGETAMRLVAAGEDIPTDVALDLLAPHLVSEECAQKGWVIEGLGCTCTFEMFEEAIVMAAGVGQEDVVASKPDVVFLLDLPSLDAVVSRVTGRRIDPVTGAVYHADHLPVHEPAVVSRLQHVASDKDKRLILSRVAMYSEGINHQALSFAVSTEQGVLELGRAREALAKKGTASGSGGSAAAAESNKGGGKGLEEGGGKGSKDDDEDDGDGKSSVDTFVAEAVAYGGRVGSVQLLDGMTPWKKMKDTAIASIEMVVNPVETESHASEAVDIDYSVFPPNAFAVTLFCLEHHYEARAVDFMPHMFELFPDKDYCILTVPSTSAEGVLLKYFQPVPARSGSTFSHVLYVLHRDSLPAYKCLRVERFNVTNHQKGVDKLISNWEGMAEVSAAITEADRYSDRTIQSNPSCVAYAAMLGHQVVGVVVADRSACSLEDLHSLKGAFHVEDLVSFDRNKPSQQAAVTCLVVSPIFACHTRFLLKEVMRLFGKSVLYWKSPAGKNPPATIPWHMIPVAPRRRMQVQPLSSNNNSTTADGAVYRTPASTDDGGGGGDGGSSRRLSQQWQTSDVADPPSSLYMVSKIFLTEPKVTVNSRLVIVGASTCALSMLEEIVFTQYLAFTSITLVAPEGLPSPLLSSSGGGNGNGSGGGNAGGSAALASSSSASLLAPPTSNSTSTSAMSSSFLPVDEDGADAYRIACLGLGAHIRVIKSRMVDLDRDNKAILLPDGSVVPYDVLTLATGLQDNSTKLMGLWTPGKDPSDPGVPGVLSLHTVDLEAKVMGLLDGLPTSAAIAIYGGTIKTLTAVEALIERGVAAERIILIRPQAAKESLGEAYLDHHVGETVEFLGVKQYNDLILSDVTLDGNGYLDGILLANAGDGSGGGGGGSGKGSRDKFGSGGGGGGGGGSADDGALETGGSSDDNVLDELDGEGDGGGGGGDDDGNGGGVSSRGGASGGGGGNSSTTKGALRAAKAAGGASSGSASKRGSRTNRHGGGGGGGNSNNNSQLTRLKCSILLLGNTPTVDPDLFLAVNGSGLVFDGRMVVDLRMRTVDDSIYAAGTLTKFSRVHQRSTLLHSQYNSREVGKYLAKCVIAHVDPLASDAEVMPPTVPPHFIKPRTISGVMPGGFYYMRSVLPDAPKGNPEGVRRYVTGDVDAAAGLCSVKLDALDRLAEMCYLGKEVVECRNLAMLVGLQQSYLGNIAAQMGGSAQAVSLTDLIGYFRSDHFSALYHDRFEQFMEEVRKEVEETDDYAMQLMYTVQAGLEEGKDDEWLSLTIKNAVGDGASNVSSVTHRLLQSKGTEFVRKNKSLLGTFKVSLAATAKPKPGK